MELTKEEKELALEAYLTCNDPFDGSLCAAVVAVLKSRAASVVLGDQGLRKAAQDFVNKLEMVEPAINGAFAFQAIHGANYDGPDYSKELKALKAALTRQDGPVLGEEQPPYKKCGKVAQTFIAREGSFFTCALEEGHEGPCLQSGTCFRHGVYFGKNCPHWPKCADQLLAPRRGPSHPMSGTMQDEVRVTDRPQETSQQEADSLKLKCLSCNSEVENPACQVCGAIMVPAYLLKLGYRLSADGTFWIPPVNESVGKWIRKCIAVEKERDDLKIKLKAIEEQKAVPQSGQPPSQQESSVQLSTDDVVERAAKAYTRAYNQGQSKDNHIDGIRAAMAVARAGWHSWESVEKAIRAEFVHQFKSSYAHELGGILYGVQRLLSQQDAKAEPAERVTDPAERVNLVTGDRVRLVGQKPGETFTIESSSIYEQRKFYRLKEINGGLFLRESFRLDTQGGNKA